jgi:hypothetical protein
MFPSVHESSRRAPPGRRFASCPLLEDVVDIALSVATAIHVSTSPEPGIEAPAFGAIEEWIHEGGDWSSDDVADLVCCIVDYLPRDDEELQELALSLAAGGPR